ncbi:MAG: NHL repeat-containing protein, partial [bacterium]
LSLSPHVIQFSTLSRWITPANITVSPTNQVTLVVTGAYTQVTGLAVDISPAAAVATGAQWRVSGGSWINSGVLVEVPAGTYTVQFKAIGGNWLPPGDVTAVVVAQQVTAIAGTYYQADIFGGNISTNLGDFWWPYGVTLDAQHRLVVADTWNDRIQMYDPLSQGWSVIGPKGTSVGQFKKPFGLVVDSRGNLYVADQNNNRVQKRNATNGVWTIVGSNTLGSALGQFNQPADVAVDSSLSLYVADVYNDRIQRFTTSGVWSVFITNGMTAGRVYRPKGVMVDSNDVIYVTDSGSDSNSLSRVQKFSKTGQFLTVLGNNQPANGGLQSPAGLALGNGTIYVADVLNNRIAASPETSPSWSTLVGGTLSNPEDVAWDPRGYLYIADTLNSRILRIPIIPGVATNGLTSLSALVSTGTNTAFTISWYGRLNWNYAVQYAGSLMSASWQNLPGCTNIAGMNMITNCTDTTVLGITNRFYRVVGY